MTIPQIIERFNSLESRVQNLEILVQEQDQNLRELRDQLDVSRRPIEVDVPSPLNQNTKSRY